MKKNKLFNEDFWMSGIWSAFIGVIIFTVIDYSKVATVCLAIEGFCLLSLGLISSNPNKLMKLWGIGFGSFVIIFALTHYITHYSH